MNSVSPLRAAFPTLPAVTPPTPGPGEVGRLLRPDAPAAVGPAPTTEARPAEGSFASMLGRMVAEVSTKQSHAAQAVANLQSGQPVAIHQAIIAMEEASVSFQLMAEVRNRLLESYQELMRMQV
ncbi:MAG: flagellar hook-basal body complex protein FliE [Verrucomicrobiales bacterium]|nr:flagellar hook-basal body complex protein FliE [Verrucomicrobiales bacterium]